MADDNDDWFAAADEPAADGPAPAGGGDTAADAGGVGGGEKADKLVEEDLPTIKRRTNKDLDSPIIFKVWKR